MMYDRVDLVCFIADVWGGCYMNKLKCSYSYQIISMLSTFFFSWQFEVFPMRITLHVWIFCQFVLMHVSELACLLLFSSSHQCSEQKIRILTVILQSLLVWIWRWPSTITTMRCWMSLETCLLISLKGFRPSKLRLIRAMICWYV